MNGTKLRLILVEPQGPINLGACARVCDNFGIDEWAVVRPICRIDDSQALEFATGPSSQRFRSLGVFETLEEALAETHLSIGFCGKPSGRKSPSPIELPELASEVARGGIERVALVFGNERVGLSFEDLVLCSKRCQIRTGAFDSLNLSHAVAVAAARIFEERSKFEVSAEPIESENPRTALASRQDLEGMFAHGREFLTALDFTKAGNPDRIQLLFRRVLDRAALRVNEVKAFRSVFTHGLARMGQSRLEE